MRSLKTLRRYETEAGGTMMLEIDELKKQYDNFLLDCSLKVRPGQVTGLVGQNGAGKSTLFKAVLGLISVDGGSVRILGKELKDFGARDRQDIGVALSSLGFGGCLKVGDMVPILAGLYERFDKALFQKLTERFQLPGDRKISDFSTGMKAKLKVVTAISHGAKFLILDEPTAGLDVIARDGLLELMREFMEEDEDRAILISSHISSDLEGLCDDIYMIHEGKIILHEDTDVLLGDYAVIKADERQFADMDKAYIVRYKKESFGYSCLASQKQYYIENYPRLAIEKGSIDGVITMMIKGVAL